MLHYLMPGDELNVYQHGIGAFSSGAAPSMISMVNQYRLTQKELRNKQNLKVRGSGTVNVVIRYKDQDGIDKTITKPLEYTVGMPSGASISAEKMNVVYIGVDNPMTISGGTVGAEKVHVTFRRR